MELTHPVYQNVGIFVLRKYAGLLDLPFVFITYLPRLFTAEPSSERALLVGTWRQYFTARAAFHSHASQLVWDRYLCVVERSRDTTDLLRWYMILCGCLARHCCLAHRAQVTLHVRQRTV